MRILTTSSLCLALLFLAPGAARAEGASNEKNTSEVKSQLRSPGGLFDASPQSRQHMISVFAFPSWYYGFGLGAGARYMLPLADDGILPELNDSFELEFGADAWFGGNFGYTYTGLAIPVEGMWTLHFTDKFSAYAKLGLGWHFAFWNASFVNQSAGGFLLTGGPGLLYKFSDNLSFRAEANNFGLRAGIGLSL